jgi:hypothetical protein
VIEVDESKVKVGWLYWENPDYNLWLETRSDAIAPYLSRSTGSAPLTRDRNYKRYCEPMQVIQCCWLESPG